MSHVPQRKEKDCLNCGTIVQGRYCHVCGQENVVPKETFWHMFTHFFYDITHFDSSFFTTVKDLLVKPGFLSKEYMKGRRTSYLHPVRMYVFTSAIFFLIFFSFFADPKMIKTEKVVLTAKQRATYSGVIKKKLVRDSSNVELKEKLLLIQDTAVKVTNWDMSGVDTVKRSVSFGSKYRTFEEYDLAEKKLPASKRDGWLMRRFNKIGINMDRKFRENPDEAAKKLIESILHRLPYLLLMSLPFFALILKLVYIRRKQFYYADHGVFTIHLYVFSFMNLLVVFSLDKLHSITHWKFMDDLQLIVFLGQGVYLFIAMRWFYMQGWGKTFLKFLLVAVLSLIMMLILLVILFFFSAATF